MRRRAVRMWSLAGALSSVIGRLLVRMKRALSIPAHGTLDTPPDTPLSPSED